MRIQFPGTRGEIDVSSRYHRRHSCLLIEGRVLVDCGLDWLGNFGSPEAIVLTHAHADHVGGLKHGTDCPVYATAQTWARLKSYTTERSKGANTNANSRRVRPQIRGFPRRAFSDRSDRWISGH
jgi:glyoxylase-like metal-dependent hydrolase (beta-lactamase superfamily II)